MRPMGRDAVPRLPQSVAVDPRRRGIQGGLMTHRYRWLIGGSLAGIALTVTLLVHLAVSRALHRMREPLDRLQSRRVYDQYDLAVRRQSLARATQAVGKEVIKVERLSDRFTVPQKLTIQGTPYEIGLTVGHIGRQAKACLPMLAEALSRPELVSRRPLSTNLSALSRSRPGRGCRLRAARGTDRSGAFRARLHPAPLVRPAPAREVLPGHQFRGQ